MLRSSAAKAIFNEAAKENEAWQVTLEECMQPNFYHSTPKPELTDAFWRDIKTHDFDYILRNYSDIRYALNIKREILTSWQSLNDKGYVVADYFKEKGLLNIALTGDNEGIARILSEIHQKTASGEETVNIIMILDVYGIYKQNEVWGVPIINESNITDEMLAPVDCVLVVDEVNSSDMMTRLTDFGIGMEYVIPLSFVLSKEE